MRLTCCLFMFLTYLAAFGNMASPYQHGTLTASAISSKDIDVVAEQIVIRLSPNGDSAYYTVTYHLKLDSAGLQIPLLFVAEDYAGKFVVSIDGKAVKTTSGALLDSYSSYNLIRKFSLVGDANTVTVQWDWNNTSTYRLRELIYFEADLDAGEHTVKVEYTAVPWHNRLGWVRRYNHRYSLTPAKYWRSFGSLDITLEAPSVNGAIATNLNSGTTKWHFNKLPAEFIEITYVPHISKTAEALIALQPEGIALIFFVILTLLHLYMLNISRKPNHRWGYKAVLITGGILIPFLAFLIHGLSYGVIDRIIGPAAASYHGYVGFVFLLYPITVPFYFLIIWLCSRLISIFESYIKSGAWNM